MMKWARQGLKKLGVYEYVRYSGLFRLYTRLFKPRVLAAHQKEVAFYRSFLPPCSLIFDIGAHDGHKSAAFLELAERVVACEPDRLNFRTLQIRFRKLRRRVVLVNKALSAYSGTANYYVHHAGSAFNTLNPHWKQLLESDTDNRWNERIQFEEQVTVPLTTLDALMAQHGVPGFIKIDVEGYELPVLEGLSQRVPFLSFECLLPDCKLELLDCLARLYLLDPAARYNVAREEALLLDGFISYHTLLQYLAEEVAPGGFEIIVQMNIPAR